MVFEICNKYGFTSKIEICNSLESYFIKLELGYGVTFFDTSVRLAERSVESFVFINILEEMAMAEVIAAWNNKNNNPAVPFFLEELKNAYKLYNK